MNKIKLGSLFDGSGGFPLAATICGMIPVWASEVEPFPIRVTTKNFPNMKHLGDISKINGKDIEPVDIITFGSPCQDMSIAGRRTGLNASRSGLFFEAIRIIKEMRNATNGKYPRYIIWENVTGAFSSNKGADFKSVIEEICSIKEHKIDVPKPKRWGNAGEIVGDDFSAAWRVFDAQYWGVPQRRKRIYLIADFAGKSAGKILFESKSVPWYSQKSFCSRKGFTGTIDKSAGTTGHICLNDLNNDRTNTPDNIVAVYENHSQDTRYTELENIAPTVSSTYGTGGNNQPFVVVAVPRVAYGLDRASFNQGKNAKFDFSILQEQQPTLTAKGLGAIMDNNHVIRRLTPTECARLQGFPDWWCSELGVDSPTSEELHFWKNVFMEYAAINNKKPKSDKQILKWLKNPHSDSAEYKMWGNGIALPCAVYVIRGIYEVFL